MLIFPERKIAFVAIPKAASSSVGNYLADNIPGGVTIGPTHMKLQYVTDLDDDWRVFTFVRHPLDRMVSYYHYLKRHLTELGELDINYQALDRSEVLSGFDKFIQRGMYMWNVDSWTPFNIGFAVRYGEPQVDYLGYRGEMRADFVGKFENLEEDFDRMCRELDIPNKGLPELAIGEHEPYLSYYTEELAQLVYARQIEDFEAFGYSVPWKEL